MYTFFYILYLLLLSPKLFLDRLRGKRHPKILQRLGQGLLTPSADQVIWLHGVSVGEIKAVKPFFLRLKEKYQNAFFLITTTTMTGQEEARRSLVGADAYRYLPLDLPWVVRKFAKTLKPRYFFLIESDFWPNLLKALKGVGCQNILISGKMSERSFRRFKYVPFFTKTLFSYFDKICVQTGEYLEKFSHFAPASRLYVTGNLKWDSPVQPVEQPAWVEKVSRPIVTVASTHAPEEKDILDALRGLDALILLAPRHPERYKELIQWLSSEQIPFQRFSQLKEELLGETRAVFIDSMGNLPLCYTLSQAAIVGGSFVSHVGGHNIFEPCLYGCPPFFGPHMFTQKEFVEKILAVGGGVQCFLPKLREQLEKHLQNPTLLKAPLSLLKSSLGGATEKTFIIIEEKKKVRYKSPNLV